MANLEFVPSGDYLLVKDTDEDTTIGGIELPKNVRQKEMLFGVIVAVGDTVNPKWVKGTIACYGPYAGMTVVLGGTELRMLREGQIAGGMREIENHEPGDDAVGRITTDA